MILQLVMRRICSSPPHEVDVIAPFDIRLLGNSVISTLILTSFIHACEPKTDHLPM